jgi:hypothetical protein
VENFFLPYKAILKCSSVGNRLNISYYSHKTVLSIKRYAQMAIKNEVGGGMAQVVESTTQG